MQSPTSLIRNEATLAQARIWWQSLNAAWKQAFNEVALKRSSTEDLGDELLLSIYIAPAHRFAGPTAAYPNMSFELKDLSGMVGLPQTEILVVVHHQLSSLREVAGMKHLRSLFVYNNQIASLDGIEDLTGLEELYINVNQVRSLRPLAKLTRLKTLYCNYNQIDSLEGISAAHADHLEQFFCLPNANLKANAAFQFEREYGIQCRKG